MDAVRTDGQTNPAKFAVVDLLNVMPLRHYSTDSMLCYAAAALRLYDGCITAVETHTVRSIYGPKPYDTT